ncbi:hypothetical protein D9758_011408 [Tetrapyrgos nigripes]|uniref:Uncharacterized protein n=1 Tax=Tetrapyrgos nigripes TaxID=182062 RepID=A0A8H5CR58_9AGAR|nr:hypothetical protein D9758_011408 [Tetrapyrgos nigripes]
MNEDLSEGLKENWLNECWIYGLVASLSLHNVRSSYLRVLAQFWLRRSTIPSLSTDWIAPSSRRLGLPSKQPASDDANIRKTPDVKQPISQPELELHAHAAWIKLRYRAPWIAYRCNAIKHDLEPNSYYFSYDITDPRSKSTPDGLKNLRVWADETVTFRPEIFMFEEWEMEIKEVYWFPTDGHFAMDLQIAKGVNDKNLLFFFTAPHYTTDGRGLMGVSDMFYRIFAKELQGSKNANHVSYQNLRWGEEVSRLTPASSALLPDVGEDAVSDSSYPSTMLQFERVPFKSQYTPIRSMKSP